MKQKDCNYKTTPITAEKWFKRGYDAKTPEVKIECYEKALDLVPDNPWLWELMGIARFDTEEFEEALKCFNRVSGELSNHPEHLCNLGYAYFRLKKYDDALNCYKRVTNQADQHRRAWELSGQLLFETDREEDARDCFGKAEKFPESGTQIMGELYAGVIKWFEKDHNPLPVLSDDSRGNIEDFRIFNGEDGTYWGEHKQMKEIVSLLSAALNDGLLESPLYVLLNVRVANGEIDCLILMKHGPVILELKNYLGLITGSENGKWKVQTHSGETVDVTSNVFRQCNKHRFDFYKKYQKIARENFPGIIEYNGQYTNLIKIQSWGYFRRGSRYDEDQIAGEKVKSWFAVITGDELIERLKYVDAGYTLFKTDMDAISEGMCLNELSVDEYGWFGIQKEEKMYPVSADISLNRGTVTIPDSGSPSGGSAAVTTYSCESGMTPGGIQVSGVDSDYGTAIGGSKVNPPLPNTCTNKWAYYCSKLMINHLKSNDLKNAYKYSGDLIRHFPDEKDIVELHTQLEYRMKEKIYDLPEDLVEMADRILHNIIVSEL